MELCSRECLNKACYKNKKNYSSSVLKIVSFKNYSECKGYKKETSSKQTRRKLKNLTIKEMEEIIGLKICTINVYLCREEFSHIITKTTNGRKYFTNIYSNDIKRIRELTANRKHKKLQECEANLIEKAYQV